jgi:hypothetical protein
MTYVFGKNRIVQLISEIDEGTALGNGNGEFPFAAIGRRAPAQESAPP